MKNYLSFAYSILLFLLSLNTTLSAECGLNDPIISNIKCLENANYEFDVNFAISDPSLDTFVIYINDNFYGKFSIFELPVKVIQNNFSGKKNDKLKISDPDRENCYVVKEIENPCSCAIFDFKYAKTKCTDTSFYIVLDFNHFETSDSFDIGRIGKFFGTFSYSKLPITIGPFKTKDTTYVLNVVDRVDFFCFTDFSFKAGKCPDCSIKNISLNGFECEGENKIYLKLSFLHTNVKSSQYVVMTDSGQEKIFEYKNKTIFDSVTFKEDFILGPIEFQCNKPLTVSISDKSDNACNNSVTLDSLCCKECIINEISVQNIECQSDTTFGFKLNFSYSNNNTNKFKVYLKDAVYGEFDLNQLPLAINNIKTDPGKFTYLKVCMDNGQCCKAKEFETPDCNKEDCLIDSASWIPIFDTIAGKYWIKLDLVYHNTSESFTVKGNGLFYGTFNYSNLPVILGSFKCSDNKNLEFIIRDSEDEMCKIVLEPGVIKCPTSSAYEINSDADWLIYKNMNENHIDVVSQSEITKNAVIEVINIVGGKVAVMKVQDGLREIKIKLPETSDGIYIIRFKNAENIYTKKIFLKRG
ncbi:MAG: T9SS type A sorting domain-containing protein [Saprospiraceae bacterium]|nr:T9SS type A sorting domain-containing protein [Saprospiraceae bacterium]